MLQSIIIHSLDELFSSLIDMNRRIPPLNALRAFEAGARHLNFTRAADELAVTPTAISHQVRHLEDWFGVVLFNRNKRQLALTDSGAQLYPVISQALDRIAEASCRIRQSVDRATLTVSVTPTFGSRWLASRLGRFWAEHPEIDLRIHHSVQLADFTRNDADLAIRWGLGLWTDVISVRLMDAAAVPICSPSKLAGSHPLLAPSDLRHHVLLHEINHQEWSEWMIAAGLDEADGRRGPVLDDPNSLVRAAIEGHGVFLGSPAMLSSEFDNGVLIQPFATSSELEPAYFLVYPEEAIQQQKIQAFRDFILSEVNEQ